MIQVVRATLDQILPLRNQFLKENKFQIRYNACHERGWADEYLLMLDGVIAGYGSVKGRSELTDRDSIFEFYLIPAHRSNTSSYFDMLIKASQASCIEAQSNEPVLTALQAIYTGKVTPEAILFGNPIATSLKLDGFEFRPRSESDVIFQHHLEPIGAYVIERNGEIVATGGFMTHYNKPFVDLYMEVNEPWRRRGLGSYMIQEIKRVCIQQDNIPSARCGMKNTASRNALRKAGFQEIGCVLSGEVIRP